MKLLCFYFIAVAAIVAVTGAPAFSQESRYQPQQGEAKDEGVEETGETGPVSESTLKPTPPEKSQAIVAQIQEHLGCSENEARDLLPLFQRLDALRREKRIPNVGSLFRTLSFAKLTLDRTVADTELRSELLALLGVSPELFNQAPASSSDSQKTEKRLDKKHRPDPTTEETMELGNTSRDVPKHSKSIEDDQNDTADGDSVAADNKTTSSSVFDEEPKTGKLSETAKPAFDHPALSEPQTTPSQVDAEQRRQSDNPDLVDSPTTKPDKKPVDSQTHTSPASDRVAVAKINPDEQVPDPDHIKNLLNCSEQDAAEMVPLWNHAMRLRASGRTEGELETLFTELFRVKTLMNASIVDPIDQKRLLSNLVLQIGPAQSLNEATHPVRAIDRRGSNNAFPPNSDPVLKHPSPAESSSPAMRGSPTEIDSSDEIKLDSQPKVREQALSAGLSSEFAEENRNSEDTKVSETPDSAEIRSSQSIESSQSDRAEISGRGEKTNNDSTVHLGPAEATLIVVIAVLGFGILLALLFRQRKSDARTANLQKGSTNEVRSRDFAAEPAIESNAMNSLFQLHGVLFRYLHSGNVNALVSRLSRFNKWSSHEQRFVRSLFDSVEGEIQRNGFEILKPSIGEPLDASSMITTEAIECNDPRKINCVAGTFLCGFKPAEDSAWAASGRPMTQKSQVAVFRPKVSRNEKGGE